MRISRLYYAGDYQAGDELVVTPTAYHYLVRVLRLSVGDELTLFNGKGPSFQSQIVVIDKKKCHIKIITLLSLSPPFKKASLHLHLAQSIIKADKMDMVIQKAVELGVDEITPLATRYSEFKFTADRIDKKMKHWEGVIINACEQSGQNILPRLNLPQVFSTWLSELEKLSELKSNALLLILDPRSATSLSDIERTLAESPKEVILSIGPEGGFSDKEMIEAQDKGFQSTVFGSRILRSETAGLAAMVVAQWLWGDFRVVH